MDDVTKTRKSLSYFIKQTESSFLVSVLWQKHSWHRFNRKNNWKCLATPRFAPTHWNEVIHMCMTAHVHSSKSYWETFDFVFFISCLYICFKNSWQWLSRKALANIRAASFIRSRFWNYVNSVIDIDLNYKDVNQSINDSRLWCRKFGFGLLFNEFGVRCLIFHD